MTESVPPQEIVAASKVLAGAPVGWSSRVTGPADPQHTERPVPYLAGALSYPDLAVHAGRAAANTIQV